MVIPEQYIDELQYSRLTTELDEFNIPIESEIKGSILGRLENFSNSGTEYMGKDGITVLSDATFYVKFGQELPQRFDLVYVPSRDYKGYIIHVYRGQLNYTIFLKEVK